MKITWEVDDGYVGNSRPHHTEVPDEELAECDTEDERQQVIEEYVQNHFDETISWSITKKG
jgi:hypothetical protein